jgi:hypothetical protein
MNETPLSFIEFPDFNFEVPFSKKASIPLYRQASLAQILAAQSVDHAVCILMGTFLIFCGVVLSGKTFVSILSEASPIFWITQLLLLSTLSFFYRFYFLILREKSLGQILSGISVHRDLQKPWAFWGRQGLEALQLAFPLLWALDLLSRKVGEDICVRYKKT